MRPTPVLVAPDKFKGSLSAKSVSDAIVRGLADAGVSPAERVPIADGGEGTAEVLLAAAGGRTVTARVEDPLGREINARFSLLGGGERAVVEVAEASGLCRGVEAGLAAEAASTRGTGQLISAAVSAGAREVIVAVGGSATTDGGRGALEALGARFDGQEPGLDDLRRRLEGARLIVACDVDNPLCGPAGAAAVFAPQKGADAAAVGRLELRLEEWAELARAITGRDPANREGAGAGGGIAGGLWAFADAEIQKGTEMVFEAVEFERRLGSARLVITGEGRIDSQTLGGKAVAAVAARCRRAGVPCVAIVGQSALSLPEAERLGIEVIEAAAGEIAETRHIAAAAARLAPRLLADSQLGG